MVTRRSSRGRLASAAVLSLAAHGVVGVALWSAWPVAARMLETQPIYVTFSPLTPPKPVRPPAPDIAEAVPAPKAATPQRSKAPHQQPAPAPIHALVARDSTATPVSQPGDGLSESQLAGAATAESGSGSGGGGDCNMARRLQEALRKDSLVQAAVATASSASHAIWVWNGDWVQSGAQDGKGLAAVREAISWEVAFAPKACRAEAVRGLILLKVSENPGAVRLALGSGDWRWSDLLRTSAAP